LEPNLSSAAGLVPARRASRIDPLLALHYECSLSFQPNTANRRSPPERHIRNADAAKRIAVMVLGLLGAISAAYDPKVFQIRDALP
jgi:hypothetical protein